MPVNVTIAQVIDTTGEFCPLPVVKAKLAIDKLSPGQVLKVICTDPGSKSDFPGWASTTGNQLLEMEDKNDSFIFYIQKS